MDTTSYLKAFEDWYKSLKVVKANGGPANGTIAAALVVLDRLKSDYNLHFEDHLASGGAQIKGVSGAAGAAILAKFEETRSLAREGGRTNRGGPGEIRQLFDGLAQLQLELLPPNLRNELIERFQFFLVQRVRDFHNRQKIKMTYNDQLSTWQVIHELLKQAAESGKTGYVAQHLVGAKLQLRFPGLSISNESVSTADRPTNRQGDFLIGNTIFHVTVAPMVGVFEKCKQNINEGYRAYLLVGDDKLAAARQMGEQYCGKKIAVESLESFLSQNVEELGAFAIADIRRHIWALISLYNQRVDAVEIDKSLMIELPETFKRYG